MPLLQVLFVSSTWSLYPRYTMFEPKYQF